MKKNIALFLVFFIAIGMAACSSPSPSPTAPPAAPQTQAPAAPQTQAPATPQNESKYADYPAKSIELVVPSAAGTGFDAIARKIAEVLPKYLENNVTIYVNNRNDAGGAEGWTAAYNSEPDGYTLLFYGVPDSIIAQKLYDRSYDVMEMTALAAFTYEPSVLLVNPKSSNTTFEEAINASQSTPLVFGDSGAGGSTHLESLVLTTVLDIPMRSVHFSSVPEVITSWERNETEFLMISLPTALSWISSDSARPLCITSKERSTMLPDVPSIYEIEGISKEDADLINGTLQYRRAIWAPPGMDKELSDILVSALEKAASDPDFLEWANSVGREIIFTQGDELDSVYQALYENHSSFMDIYENAIS